MESLVPVLSYILTKMVERNDKLSTTDFKRTVFHAEKAPLISLPRYLERVLSFAPCSNSCFIIALIYIDRIIQSHADFVLNSLSVHRMLITSVMLATKFFDDETFNNLYYARVGGLQVSELNQLEQKFLLLIDFSLTIPAEVFERYRCELSKHAKVTCTKPVCSPTKILQESHLVEHASPKASPRSSGNPSCARAARPCAAVDSQATPLVRTVCEALIKESTKEAAVQSKLLTRMSEMLNEEEKMQKLAPGSITTLCSKLVSECNAPPSLVACASAQVERLEKLESARYQSGCDYTARDAFIPSPAPCASYTYEDQAEVEEMKMMNTISVAKNEHDCFRKGIKASAPCQGSPRKNWIGLRASAKHFCLQLMHPKSTPPPAPWILAK